ncbi:hypothetical protein [Caulobacter sp. RL271]|uniref:Terminase small subunit n=1 Tax=Caulobacter segnis TaxID=88688 RepID=A0ABY4ZY22_9CAUL|nr:hypothetical protein [Caulobacter segnis]USQ97254.1 hypothetical protein MZV50_06845 [Caulobacter segnis]
MSAAAAKDGDLILSKGEAARELNVSAGRVSQYIAEAKIYGPAIVGEGRSARINVTIARQQLKASLDLGQRLGNGITTDLADREPAVAESDAVAPSPVSTSGEDDGRPMPPSPMRRVVDPFEEAIKQERLRSLQFTNREKAEQELARRGTYTLTAEIAAALASQARSMIDVFEGGLADLATAMSAKFGLSQRDVLHELRTAFVEVRRKAAETARRKVASMPNLVPDEVAIEGEEPG